MPSILSTHGARPTTGVSLELALSQIPWFSNFSSAELKSIERIGRICFAAQDEYLFREGDPGDSLYLILSGVVEVVRLAEDGTEICLATLNTGKVIGELAIIDGGPRSASVRAKEPTELFAILRSDFLSLVGKSPQLLPDLLVELSSKMRNTNTQYYEAAIQQNKLRVEQEVNRLRSMGEMIAGLAHEINTPLGIVNHAASIIARRIDSEAPDAKDDIREATKLILDGVARADRLVKTFKNLSASQVSDSKATVSIRALIDECTTLYALKARASHLKIDLVDQLADGDGQWEGYPGHFSQIILNLLTNADRYAYPEGIGGEVRIVLGSSPGAYLVTVQDFGRGIGAEDLPRIFDPFFTTGRSSGGTGLGMAIVRNLVTSSLQGDITLESAPGKGTAVKLTIPRICS
jgi:signal transduction histidine kinase